MATLAISLVLPCYNEEANIERTVREVSAWLRAKGYTYELIVVNDGSRDQSAVILEKLRSEFSELRVVQHQVNQGYGLAIRSGIDAATQPVVGFMDSDGQFRIESLEALVPHLATYTFVTGRRRRRADSFVRNSFGKILGLMNWLVLGVWVRDVNCGFKIFARELWPNIRPVYGVEKLFNTEIFLRLQEQHIPWKTIDIDHYPRTAGNPTGAKLYVIIRMFQELWGLRKIKKELRAHNTK
jgi:glycosyltransferase involved in cell wall biosynthesis